MNASNAPNAEASDLGIGLWRSELPNGGASSGGCQPLRVSLLRQDGRGEGVSLAGVEHGGEVREFELAY